jgi:signal peptidase
VLQQQKMINMNVKKIIYTAVQTIIFTIIVGIAAVLLLDHFDIVTTVKPYVVLSGSMEPALPVGSVAFVRPDNSYSPGDIITFNLNGKANGDITHRIVFRKYPEGLGGEPVYLTGGDANEELDQWEVQASQIKGKVLFTLPCLGYAVDFVKKPQGFLLLVIIPATIVVYEELKSIIKEVFLLMKGFKKKIAERKKKTNGKIPSLNLLKKKNSEVPKVVAAVPILGALFVITAVTGSYFFDLDKSIGNVLSASNSYGDASPTPTPEPTPSPTPILEPSPTPTPTETQIQAVYINEFVANPAITFSNEWVELYNAGESEVDLTGWKLNDSANNQKDLTPLGSIPAGGFAVYTYSGGDGWLNNGGNSVILLDPGATEIDRHDYPSADDDESIGRETDGSLPWKTCSAPSQGTSNNGGC